MTRDELIKQYSDGKRTFNRVNLHGADLNYANLSNANLSIASLSHASFFRANLYGAGFCRANLRDANLSSVNLSDANLSEANLRYASLRDANLRYADLSYADLSGANLSYANLSYANLYRAKISSKTKWPSPQMILMAYWGIVSDDLCIELMLYDAENHPNPNSFNQWRLDGTCPFENATIQRSAHFNEDPELWSPDLLKRRALPAVELARRCIDEKCNYMGDKK